MGIRYIIAASIPLLAACSSAVDNPSTGDAGSAGVSNTGGHGHLSDGDSSDAATGGFGAAGESSVAGDGGAVTSVARDELPAVMAKAACDALGACCEQRSFTFDAVACRSADSARLQQELDQQYSSPNVTYDPHAAAGCIAEISTATFCGDVPDAPESDACRNTFVGKLPPGAACTSAAECARPAQGQADCVFLGDALVCVHRMTAADLPHGKAGDPCSGTCYGNNCASSVLPEPSPASTLAPRCYHNEGLGCGSMQVCAPLLAKGVACSGFNCQAGLYCDVSGVCVDTKSNGQHCNSPYECQSGFCVDSGTCAASPLIQQTCTNGALPHLGGA